MVNCPFKGEGRGKAREKGRFKKNGRDIKEEKVGKMEHRDAWRRKKDRELSCFAWRRAKVG